MKILSVASLKGGVGKTTIAAFLALSLSRMGKRVLAVDLDPNNNLTDYFLREGEVSEIEKRNVHHMLTGRLSASECTFLRPEISVIPCTPSLSRVGMELGTSPGSLLRFGANLRKLDYDYVILDTPPSAGYELRAALYASDLVLSPVGLSRWTVQALEILRDEVADMMEDMGRSVSLLAVPSMVTEGEERSLRLSSFAGELSLCAIRRSTALRRVASTGDLLKSGSNASMEFEQLAREVA